MRRLILLRHAKSSWTDPDLDDHDRPLNRRGRLCAPLMGAWLADRGERPDFVLCSSSVRTRETWERARSTLRHAPEAEVRADLYHAGPAAMLDAVREAPDSAGTAALVGHEPGIAALARLLSRPDPPAQRARAFSKFPTAACAIIDFDVESWRGVVPGEGRFVAFATPRELIEPGRRPR